MFEAVYRVYRACLRQCIASIVFEAVYRVYHVEAVYRVYRV